MKEKLLLDHFLFSVSHNSSFIQMKIKVLEVREDWKNSKIQNFLTSPAIKKLVVDMS